MSQKHYICQGAECTCKYGNTPDKLLAKTHTKHYINDQEMTGKLWATTLDTRITFEETPSEAVPRKTETPVQRM